MKTKIAFAILMCGLFQTQSAFASECFSVGRGENDHKPGYVFYRPSGFTSGGDTHDFIVVKSVRSANGLPYRTEQFLVTPRMEVNESGKEGVFIPLKELPRDATLVNIFWEKSSGDKRVATSATETGRIGTNGSSFRCSGA